MNFQIVSIPGYNTKNKKLLLVDGEPVALANGASRLSLLIQYIQGYDIEAQITDKRVMRNLKGYREQYMKLSSRKIG